MKIIASASALALLGLVASNVSAQLIYEPFDYGSNSLGTPFGNTTGSPAFQGYRNAMNGQPWFDAGTNFIGAGDPSITAGSLPTPAGLPAAEGNKAQTTSNGGASPRLGMVPQVTSGTIYYSVLVHVNDITSLTTNAATGSFFMGFNNVIGTQGGTPSTVLGRLTLLRNNATDPTFSIGVRPNGTPAPQFTSQVFQADHLDENSQAVTGDTVFVVVGVDPTVGAQVTKLWVNPSAAVLGQAQAPAPDITINGGTDAPINTLAFRLQNPSLASGLSVDEIRVDRTWSQVAPAAGTTWSGAGNGNWSAPASWSGGTVPDGAGTFVNFRGAGPNVVGLDTNRTVGTLNFKGPGNQTITGGAVLATEPGGPDGVIVANNVLTLDGSTLNPATQVVDAGPATINVYAAADPVTGNALAAHHTIGADVNAVQDLNVHVADQQIIEMTGNLSVAAGKVMVKTGPGTLQVKNLRMDQVTQNGGKILVTANGTDSGTSVLKTLNMNFNAINPATVDLSDNDLVIDYSGSSPLSTVNGQVKTGYAGGAWNGNGLSSSAAAVTDAHTGLAVVESADLLGATGGSFSGQTVDETAILVKYTYYGDANFDGKVNADDYALIDRSLAKGVSSDARWMDGDFNYDGKVDAADLTLADTSYALQGGTLSAEFLAAREAEFGSAYVANLLSSVPEPMVGAVGLALLALNRRRRAF